jgi:hypothetical protein
MCTTNALLQRWGISRAVAPPQEEQDFFLDVPYDSLVYAVEMGTIQDVVERLTDMAG